MIPYEWKRIQRLVIMLTLVSGLILCAALPARAQAGGEEYPRNDKRSNITNRYGVWFGWFGAGFQSQVQLNSRLLDLGTFIQFERTFDLPEQKNTFRIEAYYRFNPRHRVQFGYYNYRRTGLKTLNEELRFGDLVVPIGASSEATMGTRLLKGVYRYALFNNAAFESGLTVGISFMKLDVGLNTQILNQSNSESTSLTLPLPLVGFYASNRLWQKWFLIYSVDFFTAQIDVYDGSVVDFIMGLEYYPFNHVGLGVVANAFKIDLEVNDPGNFDGKVDYHLRGLAVYLSFVF